MPPPIDISHDLQARLRRIKLFLCDVDGVLTEAQVTMGGPTETKTFHIRDGLGLRLLQGEGIRGGWVSARPSDATRLRAEDLKVDFLHQSSQSKVAAIDGILASAGLTWAETLYMGDDVVDLGALRRAGVAAVPADAIPEAQALAHHVCRNAGGRGAVREMAELVLKSQGLWEGILARHSG